nr:class I SAM-dependent methyltransferase [Halovenus carboxidivorans]
MRVLEVGAGIGTMVARFFEWEILPPGATAYTAVDHQSENVAELPRYLRSWAADRDVSVDDAGRTLLGPDRRVDLETVDGDALAHAERTDEEYDLVVGAALLDIIDRSNLDALLGTLAPGGTYYFPITFDGETRFYPAHDADRTVERHYHAHMDAKPGGSSRAGGETLARLQATPGVSVDAAGSDWVVTPAEAGYPADEAYVLRHILSTVEEAVTEITDGEFEQLDRWIDRRTEQVDAGRLIYLTHQLDLLGRVDDPSRIASDSARQ